jgi:DNA repair protein RadC
MVANQKDRNVVTFFSLPISYSTWADICLKNSFNIAQKIMASCQNNLCEFWKLGISDLQKVKGIGKQRACQIASMFALSRRRNAAEVVVKSKISSSRDANTVFHSLMGELPYEEFWILLLNRANKIMKTVKVS